MLWFLPIHIQVQHLRRRTHPSFHYHPHVTGDIKKGWLVGW